MTEDYGIIILKRAEVYVERLTEMFWQLMPNKAPLALG